MGLFIGGGEAACMGESLANSTRIQSQLVKTTGHMHARQKTKYFVTQHITDL